MRPASFTRGAIVLYRIHDLASGGVIVQAGNGVNRVVGVPGDRVTHKNGMLSINGAPPDEQYAPLGRLLAIGDLDITLKPRQYAVFTTYGRTAAFPHRLNRHAAETIARRLSVVSYDDILGRVILRLRPFSRFGQIG